VRTAGRATLILLLFICAFAEVPAVAQIPDNFQRENLVAWCIVPFDAKKRSPEERAKMLKELGLRRCAYDWRAEHVATFEEEIRQYQKHGIEFTAFWNEHPTAFELFARREIRPQIWKTLTPNPPGETRDEKIASAVAAMLPLAKRTGELGLSLGLYNHGDWGGEPQNLVAVCKALREQGFDHVGIIYNFHHGHGHIHDFATALKQMQPYLLCLNLNGMVDMKDEKYAGKSGQFKILPIGRGDYERQMVKAVIDSGYAGPIGVLGHVADRDVAEVLRENIEGLKEIFND